MSQREALGMGVGLQQKRQKEIDGVGVLEELGLGGWCSAWSDMWLPLGQALCSLRTGCRKGRTRGSWGVVGAHPGSRAE